MPTQASFKDVIRLSEPAMDDPFLQQLRFFLQVLFSPAGAIALVLWLVLVITLIANKKMKWPVVVMMMWFAAMSFYIEGLKIRRLSFPLDQFQNNGRGGSTAFLAALLIPAVLAPVGWRCRAIFMPLVLYYVF